MINDRLVAQRQRTIRTSSPHPPFNRLGKEFSNTKPIMKRHSDLQKPVQISTPLAHGIAPSIHLTASWCNVGPSPQTCSIHWEHLFISCFVFGCVSACLSSWRVLLVCFPKSPGRSASPTYFIGSPRGLPRCACSVSCRLQWRSR